jgi:hypothetical protein
MRRGGRLTVEERRRARHGDSEREEGNTLHRCPSHLATKLRGDLMTTERRLCDELTAAAD